MKYGPTKELPRIIIVKLRKSVKQTELNCLVVTTHCNVCDIKLIHHNFEFKRNIILWQLIGNHKNLFKNTNHGLL